MYLWIGLGIEKKEETKIRTYCKSVNKSGVNEQSFTLPQHVSLKISFETDKYNDIISHIKGKYKDLHKITLEVDYIQQVPGVIWLKMKENSILRNIHTELNSELKEKYGVGLHFYDGDNFTFHSTLFQDESNVDKVNELFNKICDKEFYSTKITEDRLYFGTSEIGDVGTFDVVDFMELL